jgi:DNA-binding NtrC family response regulator
MSKKARSSSVPRVLVVDDEEEIRESLGFLLRSEGFNVEAVSNGEECIQAIEADSYDLVLLDLMLPGRSGLEVQKQISAIDPALPVVIITAMAVIETAVEAIRSGAYDYVTKPWNNDKLMAIVTNATRQRKLHSENMQLRRALKERFGYNNIVGKSERLVRLLDVVTQMTSSRSTVLIQGESGTGKELIAKAIHLKSPRADKPFVPVNSGSMPVDLLESTLFGHVRGAFTSAVSAKKGLFEVADEGTIFFDEIGTIGPETQAKLLRVIQEREFMRLGGTETIKVETRIIAATNSDLKRMVDQGEFREDLFYRLNVINLEVPPLRDRREDVPLLLDFFLHQYCEENGRPLYSFSPEALKRLVDYSWPGNVRELENAVERAVVLAYAEVIGVDLLPEEVSNPRAKASPAADLDIDPNSSLAEIVEAFERRVIVDRLEKTGWSQTEAAESFNIPLSTLNQKIKRHGIDSKKKRERSSA